MGRLRLLRLLVLLTAALVALTVAYYLLRGEAGATGAPPPPRRPSPATSAEQLEITNLLGGRRRGTIVARRVERRADGVIRLEGIERLEIEREDASPLVLSARTGTVAGEPGRRTMHVEGGIEMRDAATGMSVRLESLDWDERTQEVRSGSAVTLTSPEMEGKAASLVYGLEDQPAVLRRPELRTVSGQVITAETAVLHDGTRDVELTGDVRATGGEGSVAAGSLRVQRPGAAGGQRALAAGGVAGTAVTAGGAARSFRAAEADLHWDAGGEVEQVRLRGDAQVAQGEGTLSALRIDAARAEGAEWDVHAAGDVRMAGKGRDGVSRLQAEELRARIGTAGGVIRADASGDVRAEGPQGSATGDTMELRGPAGAREVRLRGAGGARKATLVTGRARVAGDWIQMDETRGTTVAEGRVEATLLPAPGGTGAAPAGPFRADAPIHFVSERLEATERGDHLLFTGTVRGWQGERNLSAARVEMDASEEGLAARGSVVSRMPRGARAAVSEADHVQVTADALDYRGREGTAVYEGSVRLRQAEGWLQAARLDATLGAGGGVEGVLASGDVTFQYRAPGAQGRPQEARGKGDRAQYLPAESLVRLFGDRAPATVRRDGPQGGTTEGRVLRYRLDSGVLEVESGARDRGRIETSGT